MNKHSVDILTVEEAADFLRIPVSTVYRLAQSGRIPAQKVGRHWRFYRPTLVNWMATAGISLMADGVTKKGLHFS